jgi:hypothetical protein
MARLSTFRFFSGLAMISAATAFCVAPACTVSSGSGDEEGGAGGEGASVTTGGTTSTGGTSSTGGSGTVGGGGASEGDSAGGADGGGGGAGGEGGASGKVCKNPAAGETTAKGRDCSDYCTAYLSTCAAYNTSDGTFTNQADCLSTCELFDDAQLCCRAYHVTAAASDATMHCPHAAGNSVCN